MNPPEKPIRPEAKCCENPGKPQEYPGPRFHHHFRPPEKIEHTPWPHKIHHGPMGFAPHGFDFFLALMHELSLSEEQVKKLHSIKFECEKNKIMTMAQIRVGELELQELLNQTEVDLDKIDAKIKEIGEIKVKAHINDVHAMINARALLTQEQKEKLKNLRPIPCNGHC